MHKILGVLLGLALVLPVTAAWADYESGDRVVSVDKAPAIFVAPAPASDGSGGQSIDRDSHDLF